MVQAILRRKEDFAYHLDVLWHRDSNVLLRRSAAPCTPGQKAVFDVSNGTVLAGVLPPGKARLVQAWIEIHHDELLANWSLAVNGGDVFKIEPLK